MLTPDAREPLERRLVLSLLALLALLVQKYKC
jgi:hypothetical protein